VASEKTLEDATDAAIARYNRKHGLPLVPTHDVRVLEVRGSEACVSYQTRSGE
jgi:hypothetical protein